MGSPIILVDCSHWFYQLVFKMPMLSTEEKETHIIFGMMNKIISHAKIFSSNKFIFVFDSNKNKRKKIFPEYKIKRNKQKRTEEDKWNFKLAFCQLNEFRMSILPQLGFKNIFIKTGYESDDIIASIVYDNPDQEFIIVSNDNDLFQLLSNKVKIYNTRDRKYYTEEQFKKTWTINPKQWVDMKIWGGCKSDEVPSPAGGFLPSAALKFIKGDLSKKTKTYMAFTSKEGEKIAKRNEKLVKLPFEGVGKFEINNDWKLNMKDYVLLCDKYDFRSLLGENPYTTWQEIMCEVNNG